jgi:hypothetical protein
MQVPGTVARDPGVVVRSRDAMDLASDELGPRSRAPVRPQGGVVAGRG